MDRITLPSGAWVTFRDPEMVPERLRRPVKRARAKSLVVFGRTQQSLEDKDDTAKLTASIDVQFDEFDELVDITVTTLVESWSFGEVTAAVLHDLPGRDYDAVIAAMAPVAKALSPFEEESEEDILNPESPTEGEPGSVPGSPVDPSTPISSPPPSSEPGGS